MAILDFYADIHVQGDTFNAVRSLDLDQFNDITSFEIQYSEVEDLFP